ncbi:MAG: DEAD/DEAH box helicase [Flavobacteriales bacterium]
MFSDLNINKYLLNAIEDLGFEAPTPIQKKAFPIIKSGKDVIGISQTGTGKTMAYMMPLLNDLKFSKQVTPRILVLVPTRELVVQVVEAIEDFTKYLTIRTVGVYGGTNINTQAQSVMQGCDIVVGTPGRLYDLALNQSLSLKAIKKLVIDEVDVMLDLGFRFQLTNIFELLPDRRQNIMFSATMTDEVEELITDFFQATEKIAIAVSGTPLENIAQVCYPVWNFYTKVNLLAHLLKQKEVYTKVLVFIDSKAKADRLQDSLSETHYIESGVVHSNKSQNYRLRSIEEFDSGKSRVLIATDVMARGIDLEQISHVICFDTPAFPENYMHRIGRTGRAEHEGKSILFYTEKEAKAKKAIEELMNLSITEIPFPAEDVVINHELTPEERPKVKELNTRVKKKRKDAGDSHHEKSAKNSKENQGGSYRRKLAEKYKKPKTRGDKRQNKNKRR